MINPFLYLKLLNLDKAKLEALRNRDYIQLEKKLVQKSYFNAAINKDEIPEFIKILKYNHKEIVTFFSPSFYGLRKIMEHPERTHTFEIKNSTTNLLTDKLIQFVKQNFNTQLIQYSELCIEENNLGSISSLLEYKEVLPLPVLDKMGIYLSRKLSLIDSYFYQSPSLSFENKQVLKNRFFYKSLGKISNSEIEKKIIQLHQNLQNQLVDLSYDSSTFSMVDAIQFYETSNPEIQENKDTLAQKKEEILTEENTIKNSTAKIESTYRRSQISNNYSSSKSDWKIIISIAMMLFTILRFCARNNSTSTASNNKYKEEHQELYNSPDYELKKIQRKLIYIHTTKEILSTQKDKFNRTRMRFDSKYGQHPFPGAHTLIKNETNKKVIFFYNTDFGGFKYKLLESNSEQTLILRYQYFFIFRGNDPYYTVYSDILGDRKVGTLFNEFDESDMKLLKTIYTNKFQKLRKQSEIIISENDVKINEKT